MRNNMKENQLLVFIFLLTALSLCFFLVQDNDEQSMFYSPDSFIVTDYDFDATLTVSEYNKVIFYDGDMTVLEISWEDGIVDVKYEYATEAAISFFAFLRTYISDNYLIIKKDSPYIYSYLPPNNDTTTIIWKGIYLKTYNWKLTNNEIARIERLR